MTIVTKPTATPEQVARLSPGGAPGADHIAEPVASAA
jgi:hypothetical protein